MKHTTRIAYRHFLLGALLLIPGVATTAQGGEALFNQHCVGCHSGHFGLSGSAYSWRHEPTQAELSAIIRDGLPQDGMPPFGEALSDANIQSLARFIQQPQPTAGGMLGRQVDATKPNPELSANYRLTTSEEDPALRYVGHMDGGSMICYDNLDMTGVRSIDFHYARGSDNTGRFAILAADPTGLGQRTNLGEKTFSNTGGWETFRTGKVGLSKAVTGQQTLCFMGLNGGGIFNLMHFTLSAEPGENDGTTWEMTTVWDQFSAGGHTFTLEQVGEAPVELWAMAFLPDGAIVATQKNGGLLLFRDGERLGPVEGIPAVWNRSQGGLMDVRPHPDYARNRWLYLSFSDVAEDDTTMTRIVRGQLDGLRWTRQQTIYQAPAQFYSDYFAHFGSRMAFHRGHLYFSVGDRGQADLAQSVNNPFGKIHRLRDDGRVPKDNPFTRDKTAQASVWSYGHRNPQGLVVHPQTGELWSAEHGPLGGDEVNLVRKGLNYGWPLVSHGTHYDGTIISESPYREGTEPPAHHWTPSIAVSQIQFYTGDQFPRWRNHLLAGSLAQRELRLLRMESNRVVAEETLLTGLGRIRDVVDGPDGYPYVVLNHPNGAIYRLVPVGE